MWLKKSLFAKLLVGMLISAIIPLSLSSIISYKTTTRSVERQVIELNQNTMDSGMDNIKRYLNELNHLSVSFYHDQTLMRYLRSQEAVPVQTLYITDQVNSIYNNRPEFQAVQYTSAMTGQTFAKTDLTQVGLTVPLPPVRIPRSEEESWGPESRYDVTAINGESVLAFHKPIVDYPSPTVLGMLSLYVGLDEVGRLLKPLSGTVPNGGETILLFIRKDMKLLLASGETPHPEGADGGLGVDMEGVRGSVNGKWNGRSGLFIYVRGQFMDLPLTMVKFVPSAVVNESANRTLSRVLAIQVVAVLFILVLAAILSYWTISPVKRLLRSIARVETGNFDVEPATGRRDELGVLEHRFQTMVVSLDDLMNREYRNRLELTTARLKMLQAQINPHFLYNTLQSIGTLALRHGSDEISDKIAELGSILRYSMDLETETVPLQKEIRHIEHYMSLQTGRFKNKLSYTLSCPQEGLGVRVPKMILQPLVENSIVHGMEKGSGSGTVHIGIELGRELRIRVMDNGKGMEQAVIERIQREFDERQLHTGQERGIGLINVLQRLRLCYEGGFQWDIQSAPYEATVITLIIPYDMEAKEGNAG
ncbi:histidine kinase [Paenibacillus filicis]|uniref:Histidine kinase n=1 Tax=Paenibacillus gyeongsangnamensis TaxID=3388067 RepID=A0ABT4QC41_9BACL|nr:histidine kinase [Paenibacillus filicis]MCZ8514458.1 histidine kinase [Paenibacillus filicis]